MQEAADCLGADSVPRYVEMKEIQELEVEGILGQSKKARYLYQTSVLEKYLHGKIPESISDA